MRTFITIVLILHICLLTACFSPKKNQARYPDCSSTDIEKVDTCLLGMTIKQAIEKLRLDTSQVFLIQEPIGVIRGIMYMQDNNNSLVQLFVERTSIKSILDSIAQRNSAKIPMRYLYQFIIDKKIVVVSWEKDQGNRSKILTIRD